MSVATETRTCTVCREVFPLTPRDRTRCKDCKGVTRTFKDRWKPDEGGPCKPAMSQASRDRRQAQRAERGLSVTPAIRACLACGATVPSDLHAHTRYCSYTCAINARRARNREVQRRRKAIKRERQREGIRAEIAADRAAIAPRSSMTGYERRTAINEAMECDYLPCSNNRTGGSLYCCQEHRRLRNAEAKRARIYGPLEPAPAPKPTGCDGCRHDRPQPASERGRECVAGRYRLCKPDSPTGPQLKETP